MSDTNTNPLTAPFSIERNGVIRNIQPFVGKRAAWEGKPYLAFQVETDGTESSPAEDSTFLSCLTWVGKTNIKNALNTIFRRFGQDFVEDSIGADGTPTAGIFSWDKFVTSWKELRSSALKLSELNDAYQAEVANNRTIVQELVKAFEANDGVQIALIKARMEASNSTLISLQTEFDERKARRSKEAATETTQPA